MWLKQDYKPSSNLFQNVIILILTVYCGSGISLGKANLVTKHTYIFCESLVHRDVLFLRKNKIYSVLNVYVCSIWYPNVQRLTEFCFWSYFSRGEPINIAMHSLICKRVGLCFYDAHHTYWEILDFSLKCLWLFQKIYSKHFKSLCSNHILLRRNLDPIFSELSEVTTWAWHVGWSLTVDSIVYTF